MNERALFRGFFRDPSKPKSDYEKRQELIDGLYKIIADLKNGCDGFMYLYDELINRR